MPTQLIKLIPIQNTEYSPTTWKAGDTVTSAKLNKMELGISNTGGALVVNADEEGHLDKTWQEIYDGNYYFIVTKQSYQKRIILIFNIYSIGGFGINGIYFDSNGENHRVLTFSADTPDDYPHIQYNNNSSESSGDNSGGGTDK